MSKVNMANFLVTEWGMFRCPNDLVELRAKAPKVLVEYENEDSEMVSREEVDPTASAGSVYRAREREIIKAISVIFSTDTLSVVDRA